MNGTGQSRLFCDGPPRHERDGIPHMIHHACVPVFNWKQIALYRFVGSMNQNSRDEPYMVPCKHPPSKVGPRPGVKQLGALLFMVPGLGLH